ncbi:hypothetical protein [Flagellimonas baculiformis]|uniref:hypothetical protein n=1 Tax=Flagellimonas baculiformis TaxID=3067310 RepID=UPI00296FC354|nr:hypothetical protein [Muricauda sp. D6]
MENLEVYYMAGNAIGTIGQLVLLIACAVLIYKQRNIGTWLMLLGSLLSIVFSVGRVAWTAFASIKNPESYAHTMAVLNIFVQFPYLLFVIGLLLFAVKYTTARSNQSVP